MSSADKFKKAMLMRVIGRMQTCLSKMSEGVALDEEHTTHANHIFLKKELEKFNRINPLPE